LTVDIAGDGSAIKLAGTIKISLRTKDEGEARLRHASVQAQVQQRRAAARNGATSLSHREILALAGEWYRDLVSTHEDDPGDPEDWAIYQDLLGDGLECFQLEDNPKQGVRVLSRRPISTPSSKHVASTSTSQHARTSSSRLQLRSSWEPRPSSAGVGETMVPIKP
jgi:hypothetical protein